MLPFDIASLHNAYADGASPTAVVDEVFARIDRADDPGIFLHLEDADRLKADATALARFNPTAEPLWGVPVAVKDNIDCTGMPTTAACPAFTYVAAEDAPAVAALRRAGALIVGKTNLDQFATGLVGLRTLYAAPRNAFDSVRIPGGSSSGSAVATARGLVSLALGTDTAGSGRVPAGLNNLVGLKPSLGRVSTRGIVPACRTLDCVSIFALTVGDAWRAFEVVAGFDAADPFARPMPAPKPAEVSSSLRIAVPAADSRRFFGDVAAETAFDAACDDLAALGADITPVAFDVLFAVAALLYDGPWVAERFAAIETFIRRSPDALHPVTAEVVLAGARYSAADAFRGLYRLHDLKRQAARLLDGTDLLAVPTVPRFYTCAEVEAEPIATNGRLGTYTNFVNLLDLCALAVPVRPRSDGLPGSVTLIAQAGAEGLLAAVGDALHARAGITLGATGWRRPDGSLCQDRLPTRADTAPVRHILVLGAHMRGGPLNGQLADRGARFVRSVRTAPIYRLFALLDREPPVPGLLRVADAGGAIAGEIWELAPAGFGDLVEAIPAPLGIGKVVLAGGEEVSGFLVEACATEGARDITHFGGWRAFLADGSAG